MSTAMDDLMKAWIVIPDFPKYEINITGSVRNAKSKRPLKTLLQGKSFKRVSLRRDGKTHYRSVNKLVRDIFLV